MNRVEILQGFLADDPKDSFSRYALALEYIKLGRSADARGELETVRNSDPSYVATYFQLGKLYLTLGMTQDAEQTFRAGIQVAGKAGDSHTQSELQTALEELQSNG